MKKVVDGTYGGHGENTGMATAQAENKMCWEGEMQREKSCASWLCPGQSLTKLPMNSLTVHPSSLWEGKP